AEHVEPGVGLLVGLVHGRQPVEEGEPLRLRLTGGVRPLLRGDLPGDHGSPSPDGRTRSRMTSPAVTGCAAYGRAREPDRARPGTSRAICSCRVTIPWSSASGRGGQPGT